MTRPPPEFSAAHHVVLNAVTYLAVQIHQPDPHRDLALEMLARALPLAGRDTPRQQLLCKAAAELLACPGWQDMAWCAARMNASDVLAALYFWRLANANEVLFPPEPIVDPFPPETPVLELAP